MKRSNSNTNVPDRDVKKTKPFDQGPANDKGNLKNEFKAFSARLPIKIESYVPEESLASHQLVYLTGNYVPKDSEKVVIPAVRKSKSFDQRLGNDEDNSKNEFKALSGRLPVKTESYDPEEISTNHRWAYLTDNHEPNDAEKVVIPTVGPPPIMMKKSLNFEADLKLVSEKFGDIRYKKVGIFIKLFPDTYDLHRELLFFFAVNNIQYLTPKKIRVFITGLPYDVKTQKIKAALTRKGFKVEEIVQVMEYYTKMPLPLFQATLPTSDRNKSIFNLTHLLNSNISVGNIRSGRLQRRTIKWLVEPTHEKVMVKSEAGGQKWVNCDKNREVVFWDDQAKFPKVSKNNFRKQVATYANTAEAQTPRNQRSYQEPPHMNNMNESKPANDFQDMIYIMQEFRKLFGKIKDIKAFAQQLRNTENSVEKFHLFSTVFFD